MRSWKCPNCETLNEGEVCAVCGLSRPADDIIPKRPAGVVGFYNPVTGRAAQAGRPSDDAPAPAEKPAEKEASEAPKKKRRGADVAAWILIIAVALILLACLFVAVENGLACGAEAAMTEPGAAAVTAIGTREGDDFAYMEMSQL